MFISDRNVLVMLQQNVFRLYQSKKASGRLPLSQYVSMTLNVGISVLGGIIEQRTKFKPVRSLIRKVRLLFISRIDKEYYFHK